MTNDAAALGAALALLLLLLLGLYRRLAGIPSQVWTIARNELGKAREEDEAAVRRALQEAADRRVAALVGGIRQYHDDIAAQFRRQIADAEVRAQLVERRAVDIAVAVETATGLMRELRAALEGLQAEGSGEDDADETRKTVEMPPSRRSPEPPPASVDDDAWDDPNEQTRVHHALLGPLRVPERRPPPVPRGVMPALDEDGEHRR